jgi:hypothetical protein
VITGPGTAVELTDTLSKVAVARPVVVLLATANPMSTFWAIVIVCVLPTCTQFTPSDDMYPLKLFPLLTTFIQYGKLPLPVDWLVLPPVVLRYWKRIAADPAP